MGTNDWNALAEPIKGTAHFDERTGEKLCIELDHLPRVIAFADDVYEWIEPWFTPEGLGYALVGDDPYRLLTYWQRPQPVSHPVWVRVA